jgi:hypothetical protein
MNKRKTKKNRNEQWMLKKGITYTERLGAIQFFCNMFDPRKGPKYNRGWHNAFLDAQRIRAEVKAKLALLDAKGIVLPEVFIDGSKRVDTLEVPNGD